MKLTILEAASAEIRAARDWYESESFQSALRFVNEVERALDEISTTPFRWPRYRRGSRRFHLHRFPYHVVYYIRDSEVFVVAIAHGSRRPGYWINRLQ